MSRDDIARYVGLALETANRGFSRLQKDGMIVVNGKHIEIVDAEALDRLIHHTETQDNIVVPLLPSASMELSRC